MSSPLVRAVFGLLVLATIAAFVITQQLKGEVPVILRFATTPGSFSPNGDGVRDATLLGFDLSERATVSFGVIDDGGNEVRRLVDNRRLGGDEKHRFLWNGRDDDGELVPDGNYRMRVIRKAEGRILDSLKKVRVDTRPPRVTLVAATPGVISPGNRGKRPRVRIRYRGPRNVAPELRVFRTDGGPTRVVFRFRGDETRSAVWDGYVRGTPAADGDYTFSVTVRDPAGNLGRAPGPEFPTAAAARAGTGVAVRHLTLRGPLGAVAAGSVVLLDVGPGRRGRRFRFALSRLGSGKVLRSGRRTGPRLRIRIPRRTRTGVHLVRVRSQGRRAVWPLAVSSLAQVRRTARRPPPLVVLPAATWQALNPLDDDLDGFADTLATSDSVRLDRPFDKGRLPAGFASQTAPLLRFLDGRKLAYDLTTDLALARGEGPARGKAAGVAFAGTERWLPAPLERRLRRYVEDGGKLASFGIDAFRRRLTVARDTLRAPTRPGGTDVFGERASILRTTEAPLAVETDGLGLFRGLDGFVGEFTRFERSAGLPAGARLLTGAGRDPGEPAFVAYRLGRGTVLRTGTAQWSSQLADRLDDELPRVTKRIWSLLSRSG